MGILVSLAASVAYPIRVAIAIVIAGLALAHLVAYAYVVATLIDRWLREATGGRRVKRLLAVAAIVELPVLLLAISITRGSISDALLLLLFASMALGGACDLVAMVVRARRAFRAARPRRAVVR